MAGYPKIWTTLLDEPWFVPLSLNARGLYLQLLILAKKQGDSGDIVARGWAGLSLVCGCDRDTVRKLVRKFQQIKKVIVVEKSARKVHLKIPNYVKYQELKRFKPENKDGQLVRKNPQQPEQSRAKQSEANRQPKQRDIVDSLINEKRAVTFSASVQSAYLKKFGKELEKMDYGVLLKKYGDEDLLKFMIENITMNNEFRNPIGMLITARKAPGSHLPDSKPQHDYDAWKMLIRQISDRNS